MSKKKYAIIDLETTGGMARRDKITEIAIVIHDGEKIVDSFETLLDPERPIPYNITRITGITDDMVEGQPKFYEVAKKVVQMTEGAIFVAHNVRFDYGFIREEFRRLGFAYTRRQLCTVRMSRKAFPGLRSYSLGNLIRHFGIKVDARHRAMADTMATVELFEKILGVDQSGEELKAMVNLGIKETGLPANITLERLHQLPEECGVYYFHDLNGDVVYVGKSINIKKRIFEHFAKQTEKAKKLQQNVHDISFELTGSELVSLLHESYEIKRLSPRINRAQRNTRFPYAIISYTNEEGFLCFDVRRNSNKLCKQFVVVSEHPKIFSARNYIKKAIKDFELCHRYCNMDTGEGPCFYYHLDQCHGACHGQESAIEYNQRAEEAAAMLNRQLEGNFFIFDEGRNDAEKAVVLVEEGQYRGFGYIDMQDNNGSVEELKEAIQPYPHNPETIQIIRRFLAGKKKGMKVMEF
ncbi:MAG: exonuclease domain-containing protein [Bacteroidota bacterium]